MNIIVKNKIENILTNNIKELLFQMRDFKTFPSQRVSPFWLDNIDEGIELLHKHLLNDSKIFIQVDSDVDGLTSAALMYLALKKINSDLNVVYRLHPDKTHGIKIGSIPEDTDLIIMPDASSNEYDKHKYYKDKGMDILVLDHHMADKYSEYACVINNQLSEDFPNKNLSGVGIVAKFLEAYGFKHGYISILDGLYDLIAVGLVADLMNLNNSDTMYYVSEGLNNITQPMFLYMGEQNYYIKDNTSITAKDVSYSIAPAFNAVFRMGRERDREMMFKAFISPHELVESKKRGADGELVECIEESYRLSANARSRQNNAILKALKQIEEQDMILEGDNVVIISVPKDLMPRELSGLVAMRISDKYQKPALVLMKDKNDNFSGSGRSIDESISFREFIEDSDIAIFAEGHDSAFGVSFSEEGHIDDFLEYCDTNYQDIDSKTYVDFKINASDINLQLAENIVELQQYYGKGFESPTFYIEDFVLPKNNTDIIGKTKDTIKISYKDMEMIRFKDTNLVDKIENTEKDLILDLIGVIEVNEWRGNRTAQFVIQKYEIKGEKFSF